MKRGGAKMFGKLRKKWNAARQRRFQERATKHLRMHFGDVMGSDGRVMDASDALDALHRKYFGSAA